MFSVVSNGKVIGHSALELGDPPMGVAYGRFIAGNDFASFLENTAPTGTEETGIQRWSELHVVTAQNIELACQAVVLARYDFGEEVEFEVTVLGIHSPPYGELFPQHVKAYHDSFRHT